MCDHIGISDMYGFICPYSIAYVYDASVEPEREKDREDNGRMSARSFVFCTI